jgi:hypothetical protein
MPLFTGTPHLPQKPEEIKDEKMWDLIRFRYDEKPEVWAEAYVYK